ncbi:MAG: hypothetical protein WBM99_13650 [Psychromonas sp.]
MKNLLVIFLAIFIQSCANIGMVPNDVSNIDFDDPEGKTGWSEYQQVETFYGYNSDQIYEAAKVGLGSAGFSLRSADKSKGTVIGEHGITMHDWNVIAAVYFKEFDNDTKVKVIAEGSKDIGFSGDVTSDGWTGKILRAMRQYLNETNQVTLKVNKSDIK